MTLQSGVSRFAVFVFVNDKKNVTLRYDRKKILLNRIRMHPKDAREERRRISIATPRVLYAATPIGVNGAALGNIVVVTKDQHFGGDNACPF